MTENAEIVWDRVRTHEDRELIEKLTNANPRRTRHERRAFAVLARKAERLGLLRAVTIKVEEVEGEERPNCGHGRPDPAMCPHCNGINGAVAE